jgi:CRISPR/Cas system CSM-associated protein Csm3 (group 7 of RAMP superfamily)
LQSFADFDRLEVLTRVTGSLVNLTPLRVGVGREPPLGSAVDIAPLRVRFADGGEKPYIPGSSLKGVLRSLAEAILRAQDRHVHDPWDFEALDEEAESGSFCLICGIFGSTKLASHVRVYDAYPDGEASTFVKTGVGINRDFRGVQPGILYTEEQGGALYQVEVHDGYRQHPRLPRAGRRARQAAEAAAPDARERHGAGGR